MSGFQEGFNNASLALDATRQGIDYAQQNRDRQMVRGEHQDAQKHQKMAQMAAYLVAAPAQMRPQLWQQIAPQFNAEGLPVPPQWDDSMLPLAQQYAQAWGVKGQTDRPAALQEFDQMTHGMSADDVERARRINLGLDPRALAPQVFQADSGMVGIDRNHLTAAPITMGQPQPSMEQPPEAIGPMTQGQAMDKVQRLEAQQGTTFPTALRLQMIQQLVQTGQLNAQIPTSQLQAPPKAPPAPSALDQRIAQAKAMGATPDQIKSMVLGSSGSTDEGGAPDPGEVDFYATMSNAGDYSWASGMARGKSGQALIAAVRKRQVELANDSGMAPQDVTANRASSQGLQKSLIDRQKYVTAVEQLNGTLNRQANLVESLMNKGAANGQSPVINRWIQSGRKAIAGDPDVAAFDAAIRGLGREHQRVLTGPLSNAQLAVSASETADTLLNRDMTPAQIRATIGVMRTEARNGKEQGEATLNDLRSQLKNMGKPSVAPSVTTQAQYDALPKGAVYMEDGKQYRKP